MSGNFITRILGLHYSLTIPISLQTLSTQYLQMNINKQLIYLSNSIGLKFCIEFPFKQKQNLEKSHITSPQYHFLRYHRKMGTIPLYYQQETGYRVVVPSDKIMFKIHKLYNQNIFETLKGLKSHYFLSEYLSNQSLHLKD